MNVGSGPGHSLAVRHWPSMHEALGLFPEDQARLNFWQTAVQPWAVCKSCLGFLMCTGRAAPFLWECCGVDAREVLTPVLTHSPLYFYPCRAKAGRTKIQVVLILITTNLKRIKENKQLWMLIFMVEIIKDSSHAPRSGGAVQLMSLVRREMWTVSDLSPSLN